jgi:hypothetical protein
MTDKNDYTAKVRTKGLDNTGVTEDIAKSMYHSPGRRTMAVVELKHARQINDDETGRKVELTIEQIYPAQDDILDEHLRQLMKTVKQNQVLKSDGDQLAIDVRSDLEPTVEQVVAAGRHHEATTDDELPDPEPDDERGDEAYDDSHLHAPGATDAAMCGLEPPENEDLELVLKNTTGEVTCTDCLTAERTRRGDSDTEPVDDGDTCPYPDCARDNEHAGPHRDPDGQDISPTAASFSASRAN